MAEGQITVDILLAKIGQLTVQLDLANSQISKLSEEIKRLQEEQKEKK